MKKFSNEKEMRTAVEKDYPIPEKLLPENMQAQLSGDRKITVKSSSKRMLKRAVSIAAAAALIVGGAAALKLGDKSKNIPVADKERKSSQSAGESQIAASEEVKQSLNNAYSRNSYEKIYADLVAQKEELDNREFYLNDIEIADEAFGEDLDGALDALPGASEPEASAPTGEASDDYYKTYLQTKGVDEADQIKTDGRFIYYTSADFVYVVDPDHGEPTVSDRISLDGYYDYYYISPELYLYDGRLIVVYHDMDNDCTNAQVYNVTDEGKLESLTSYTQTGGYNDSRMIDGKLYLITTEYVDFRGMDDKDPATYVPTYQLNGEECLVDADDIYISRRCSGYCYTTVGCFDTANGSPQVSITSTLGSEAELYCSNDNLYLMREFYEGENGYYYLSKAFTEITRITLKGDKLALSAAATVEGYVKDQFSADEYDGYFRIAVTRESDNAVYVLDENMIVISSVEGLGENETIKSVSFSGDTGYVVTFRQTDPLYTIDLSDPENPVVTDALKVSGFSTHLRQYGDGLLLGFGREADENTGITSGIKLSMFRQNAGGENEEIAKKVIGGEYSYVYSNAVLDHKYLMILPEKNIIGFPLLEENWSYDYDPLYENYYYILFRYTENGFEEFARVTLGTYSYDNNCSRAVYIDDVIYVFFGTKAVSVDMNTGEVIAETELYY